MKKIVFILLFVFASNTIFSQRPNRRMPVNNNASDAKPQKFDAAKIAGIFYFEEDKSIKKIKVKNDELKNKVLKIIQDHNTEIQKILFLKSQDLNALNTLATSFKNQDISSQNREAMIDFRKGMQKILQPIRDSVKSNQDYTDLKLKEILNEKQYSNWLKHVKKKRRELMPKRPTNRVPIQGNRQRGRRRY